MNAPRPITLGELKATGYRTESVKDELRRNLIARLRAEQALFPGIVGYDETVLPEIQNALLSRHDMLFLGLRGQGKTRMLRMLVGLLDEYTPIVAGSEINDDPLKPLSKFARDQVAELGDATPIAWLHRDQRYHEKLATPDVTIADLIGEIDLVKHAAGKHLANEDILHFGLIPRSHRGIFCMNELPDLAAKIQVGLFNVLEERDVQIRGFAVRLPLDLAMVFSANPEDYTNRGRLVTPLKDRIGSVIRTHYPLTRELGMRITRENAWRDRGGVAVFVPQYVEAVVEEISRLARISPHVNQASGVSVRMSVANLENAISNAERRAILHGATHTAVRISDLAAIAPGARGKMELSLSEDVGEEDGLVQRIVSEAIKVIFDEHLEAKQFKSVVEYLETGNKLRTDDRLPAGAALEATGVAQVRGFRGQLEKLLPELVGEGAATELRDELLVGLAEFVLEGLYSHNRCNKSSQRGQSQFG